MQPLDASTKKRIDTWLNGNYDEESKNTIRQLLADEKYTELSDAFYKDLEFGTGGLRGIMGVGSNRVNKYTFGVAAQGLSNFLKKNYAGEELKVAIAHDSRNDSDTLAKVVADIFTANGIKVYFFESLRPTPELSYAIRQLNCQSGVVLTASHNPKEYNGFKAYGPNGAQLVAPYDKMVMDEVLAIKDVKDVNYDGNDGLIEVIGKEFDKKYIEELFKLSLSQDAIERQKDMSIVFSAIHGTAAVVAPDAFKKFGFENISYVEDQMVADGNFPTVIYPNPEEADALSMALEKAKKINAELVMATDPDSDRIGIAAKNKDGDWELFNGNMTAALLIDYMLKAWQEHNKLTGKEFIVKTIVTTDIIDKIAEKYEVECFSTLTGFKYIGELMTNLEGKKKFIVGGEESYGYLVGDHVRDKDAIVSAVMIAEMAAYYKDKGISLYEALIDLYAEHGLYREKLISITKEGKAGAEEIQNMMKKFRENPPKVLAGSKVKTIKDYLSDEELDLATGEKTKMGYPASNVLQFITENGDIISARPSGTEPKIKFYCGVNTTMNDKAEYGTLTAKLDQYIDEIMSDLI